MTSEKIIIDLVDRVSRVETKVDNFSTLLVANSTLIQSQTTAVTNLLLAQSKMNGAKNGEEKQKDIEKIAEALAATKKRDKTQRIFLFVMAGLVFAGLIFNVYIGIKNSKVPEQVKQSIDNMDGISKVTRSGYVKYNDSGLSDSIKIK
jgi:hypothetical protein